MLPWRSLTAPSNRRKKKLFTERGAGEKIFFYEAPDDYAEASFVVDTIAQLVAAARFEPGECAVMYRTNAMSRLLEEAFLQARLPYRLVGAQKVLRTPRSQGCHRLPAPGPQPRRRSQPGPHHQRPATRHRRKNACHTAPGRTPEQPGAGRGAARPCARCRLPLLGTFTGRAALPLADFGGMLANWQAAAPHLTVPELFDRILNDLNYKAYIDDE